MTATTNTGTNDNGDEVVKAHQENQMSTETQPLPPRKEWLSVDTWAVLIALAAALLIRAGVLARVPW